MPQISEREFERVPLRAHAFMANVPLEDAWVVDLPHPRPGITLDDFVRAAPAIFTPSPLVRALLRLRYLIGGFFGWDRPRTQNVVRDTFADRLTATDRSSSLAAAGTRAGPFGVVYRFENEQLTELVNGTAHAAALSALVETAEGYRFYFAVYVRDVGRITPIYMALISPFRRLVVYPSLLRSVRAHWNRTMPR